MKIVYIHHSPNLGGAPKSLTFLIEGLQKEMLDKCIVYTPKEGLGTDFISKSATKVRTDKRIIPFHNSLVSSTSIKKKIKGIYGIMLAPFFVKMVLKEKPQIIHLNSSCLVFYAFFIKIFSKETRVICHLREPLLANMTSKIIIYILENYVDSIIAISENEVPENIKKEVSIISNPIYSINTEQKNLFKHHGEHAKINFTYMARCNYENGIFDFIAAAKEIDKLDINVNFIIVGASDSDDKRVKIECEKIKNLKIYDISNDIETYIMKSSCLIVPFKVPHFSRTLIEFGLSGIPSVIYDINPLNNIITDNINGFVSNCSVTSLIENIMKISANPQVLNDTSDNVFRDFRNKYNVQNAINKTLDIYNKI